MSYDPATVRPAAVGTKCVCVNCATRFYDLGRTPPVCPKCGTEQPPPVPRTAPIKRGPRMRPVFSGGRPAAADEEASADEPKVLDAEDDEAADDDEEDEVDELPDEAEIEEPAPDEHH